jgi:hypothetical protein
MEVIKIYKVYLKCSIIFKVEFPPQKEGKSSYQYMSGNSFPFTAQKDVDLHPFDFYLWGYLKTLVY